MEECRIGGCSGEYEEREILHLERWHGQPVVIDQVPAEVCSICGDTLFTPETIRRLEALRQAPPEPAGAVPLYEFAVASAPHPAAARSG